jgi:Ca2+-binding RTX toxin-like protein
MLAVLAMDSYNTVGDIGIAKNKKIEVTAEMASAGFNAQAYEYNRDTIISYRGTDTFILDPIFGYQSSIGLGSKQGDFAADFYRAVVAEGTFPFSTSVTFTGHSLGGGLAGLMAGLYGKRAVVFDNMAYRDAAAWTYRQATTPFHPGVVDPLTGQVGPAEANILYQPILDTFYHGTNPVVPNFSGISGHRMDGQFLNFQSEGKSVGTHVNWGLGPFDLHSMALLVLNMYVELPTDIDPAWKQMAFLLGPELLDLGMATKIAYSVVKEGVRPSGDVAAHSMFDDAADVGRFADQTGSPFTPYGGDDPMLYLVDIGIEFAGHQAQAAVMKSSGPLADKGVFHNTDAGLYLSVDHAAWGSEISGWNDILALVERNVQSENVSALPQAALDSMHKVDFVLFSKGGEVDATLGRDNPLVIAGLISNVADAGAFVFGTDGEDNVKGGAGDDVMIGGAEHDVLSGEGGADVLFGGDGEDTLDSGAGDDYLYGGGGHDILKGGDGVDALYGGDGADTLIGGDGVDKLYGGAGADVLITGNLNGVDGASQASALEVVNGGAGTDYIVLAIPETADISAGPPQITIESGDRADRLLIRRSVVDEAATSSDGKQPMLALFGGVFGTERSFEQGWNLATSNLLTDDKGAKYRTYSYNGEQFVFSNRFGDGSAESAYSILYNHYSASNRLEITVNSTIGAVLKVIINDFHSGDYGIKFSGPFELWQDLRGAGGGYDQVIKLEPLGGIGGFNSAIDALKEKGDDYVLDRDGALISNRSAIAAAPTPDADWHVSLRGDDANNVLIGNDVGEYFYGGAGEDVLKASGGIDHLFGGAGNDRVEGGADSDILDGGDGVDTADYRTSAAAVVVDLLAGTGSGGDAAGDTLLLIENLAGSQFGDVLTGDDGVNRLQGFDGADQLRGGGGNDRLIGGLGADLLDGGAGTDVVDYSASALGVMISLASGTGLLGDAAGDRFVSIENVDGSAYADTITGDSAVNRLNGGAGNDSLSGGGGNDYLLGDLGNDSMTGGAGADVFVFEAHSGRDVITDFWAGVGRTDRVQFTGGQFLSFADVVSHAVNGAAGVLVTISAEDSLMLAGLSMSQLRADDFQFA